MLKVFAVFDVKAAAYGNLICVSTRGLALRAFADACADQRGPLAQYPEDYAMYELGEYEPNAGSLVGHKNPIHVASASQVVDQLKAGRSAVAGALQAANVNEEVRA